MTDRTTKVCDEIVARAAVLMVENGASVGMALDRMLTYAAAQAVATDGREAAAEAFRGLAAKIEAGIFAHIEGQRGALN